MDRCFSRRLGWLEYSEESVLDFPLGLPAFEEEHRFILIERPESEPIIFLQSLHSDSLCFLSVPVDTLDSSYQLMLGVEEEQLLGPVTPDDLLCLILLTVPDTGPPTANLKAPVIIHRRDRKGVQVIQANSGYSFAQPLTQTPSRQGEPCS